MKKWFLPILLILFALTWLPCDISAIPIGGIHWHPQNPVEGDEITIFAVVDYQEDGDDPRIRMIYDEKPKNMMPINKTDTGDSEEIIYSTTISVRKAKEINITIESHENGSWVKRWEGSIKISEKEESNEHDDLLGLPRWWCAISVIFATIVLIFLTWSYFRGKRIQKRYIEETGASGIICSECGKPIQKDSVKCPYCGADLVEEEYICGKCGSPLSKDIEKCPECGAHLSEIKRENGEVDLKTTPKKSGKRSRSVAKKVTCNKCGCVYMKSEGKCPECGYS